MNCSSCNFPHAPDHLRDNLCLSCLHIQVKQLAVKAESLESTVRFLAKSNATYHLALEAIYHSCVHDQIDPATVCEITAEALGFNQPEDPEQI
jgi:hypothetical protein